MSKLLGLRDPCKVLYNGGVHYVLSTEKQQVGTCLNGQCMISNAPTNVTCATNDIIPTSLIPNHVHLAYVDKEYLLRVMIANGLKSSTGQPYRSEDIQVIQDELDALFALAGFIPESDRIILLGSLGPYINIISNPDQTSQSLLNPLVWQEVLDKVRAMFSSTAGSITFPCRVSFKGQNYYVRSSKTLELAFCSNNGECVFSNNVSANIRCSQSQPTVITSIPPDTNLVSIDIERLVHTLQLMNQKNFYYRTYTTYSDVINDINLIYAVAQYMPVDRRIETTSIFTPFITIVSSLQQIPDVTGISPPFSWSLIKSYYDRYMPSPVPSPSSLISIFAPTSSPAPAQNLLRSTPSSSPAPSQNLLRTTPSVSPAPAQNLLRTTPSVSPAPAQNLRRTTPSSSPAPTQNLFRSTPSILPTSSFHTPQSLLNKSSPAPFQSITPALQNLLQTLFSSSTSSSAIQTIINNIFSSPASANAIQTLLDNTHAPAVYSPSPATSKTIELLNMLSPAPGPGPTLRTQNPTTTTATASKPVELLNMLRSAPGPSPGPRPGPSPGPSPRPTPAPRLRLAPAPAPKKPESLLISILIGITILLIVTGITYLILR
jgi:hypothetical protein